MTRIKIGAAVSAMVLAGSLAGSVFAQEGIISKEQATEGYCHMKFPAIRPSTLASGNPQLKNKATGDVIDFYGDCSESPTSADQVLEQKHDYTFMYTNNYESE
jgi:hypothetical protein